MDNKNNTHTQRETRQHVCAQKMLVTCFSLCCARFLFIYSASFLSFIESCERMCASSVRARAAAELYWTPSQFLSLFRVHTHSLLCCCVWVSHTHTSTVHCICATCFMNLCLWDLPVCCVIASVLVENTNPTSTETQRFLSPDEIWIYFLEIVCVWVFSIFVPYFSALKNDWNAKIEKWQFLFVCECVRRNIWCWFIQINSVWCWTKKWCVHLFRIDEVSTIDREKKTMLLNCTRIDVTLCTTTTQWRDRCYCCDVRTVCVCANKIERYIRKYTQPTEWVKRLLNDSLNYRISYSV